MKHWLKRKIDADADASTSKENSNVSKYSKRKDQGQSLKEKFMLLDGNIKDVLKKKHPLMTRLAYIHLRCEIDAEEVRQIHIKFLNAGANIIRTNTATAFFSKMVKRRKGIQKYTQAEYEKLIKKAVDIAISAVNEYNNTQVEKDQHQQQAFVVGSCGHLDQIGGISEEVRINEYRGLIKALSVAGINKFCLENIQSTKDAEMLVKLLKEVQTMETSAFMMFKLNPKGHFDDETDWTQTAVRCYKNFPLDAIGINCQYPDHVLNRLEKFQEIQKKYPKQIPLVVCTDRHINQPDWGPFGRISLPIDWAELGICYIGGCCNVYAEHIKEIREELNKYNGT